VTVPGLTGPVSQQHLVVIDGCGGILVHLTGQPDQIAARLLARDGHTPPLARVSALITAYADTFGKLAAHAPVITIDTTTSTA